jgi:hypothetical protein
MELGTPSETLQDGSQTWNEAAVPALDDWNAEMADVQIAAVMDSTKAVSSGDGLNSASFASSVFGDSFGSGVLAVTYYRTQGSTMIEADVLFNEAQPFDSYRGDLNVGHFGIPIIERWDRSFVPRLAPILERLRRCSQLHLHRNDRARGPRLILERVTASDPGCEGGTKPGDEKQQTVASAGGKHRCRREEGKTQVH